MSAGVVFGRAGGSNDVVVGVDYDVGRGGVQPCTERCLIVELVMIRICQF